jgi:hypothetical protein
VLTFDRETIEALEALGFAIADDKESASVAGAMNIEIIQSAESKDFLVDITLPTGTKFHCKAHRLLVDA